MATPLKEKSSLSNYNDVRVTHMDIERLLIDFTNQKFTGRVTYTGKILNSSATEIVLDTKDLTILNVTIDGKYMKYSNII